MASTPGVTISERRTGKEGGAGGRGARPGRAVAGRVRRRRARAGEAAEVEAHLATCAACRAEAGQLGRAAAWLGAGQGLAPPERLRDAVLAAARAHPAGNGEATGPPAEAGPAAEALAAATADLDELLAGLSAEQWRLPVIHGWDVDELLRHLAAAQPPAAAGPDAALRQAFETWIHADDLRAALGRPPSPPPRSPPRRPGHGHAAAAAGPARRRRRAFRPHRRAAPGGAGGGPGRCRPGTGRRRPP